MSTPLRLLCCVLPCLVALDACKELDVCDGLQCDAVATGGGGVSSSTDGRSPASAGSEEVTAGAPQAGGGAAGEAGQDRGPASPESLQCDAGLGDCDYSKLTGCETPLAWAVRNCGACGHSCADACGDGGCLDDLLLVEDASVTDFVSNATYAFALLTKTDGTDSLIRIQIDDGIVEELLPLVGGWSQLALGDRVYLLDGETRILQSMAQDGGDLELEPTESPFSVGAYAAGTYYVSSVWEESSESYIDTLRFRESGAQAWQTIKQQARGDIRSSSDYGVIYVETDESEGGEEPDVEHLYLLQGNEVIAFGVAPQNMEEVFAVEGGIAALTLSELWWLDVNDPPVRFELPTGGTGPSMAPHREGVVVSVTEGKDAYVQRFNRDGGLPGRIGVRLGSNLEALDDHYLFHSVTDDWIQWRVLRTTWR
jgi:hypothetical protein